MQNNDTTCIRSHIIPDVWQDRFIPPLKVNNTLGGVTKVPDGWVYTGDSRKSEVLSCAIFTFSLTIENVAIATEIAQNYGIISGRYETWEQFCLVHRISMPT